MPLMPHLDTADKGSSALAALSGVGDHGEALERVYRERSVAFRNALAVVAGGHEQARDAVQEAFAVALRERARFRGEGPLEAIIRSDAMSAETQNSEYGCLQGLPHRRSRRGDSNPGPHHYEVFSESPPTRMVKPRAARSIDCVCHPCANLRGAADRRALRGASGSRRPPPSGSVEASGDSGRWAVAEALCRSLLLAACGSSGSNHAPAVQLRGAWASD
jgi:hypothetical protein